MRHSTSMSEVFYQNIWKKATILNNWARNLCSFDRDPLLDIKSFPCRTEFRLQKLFFSIHYSIKFCKQCANPFAEPDAIKQSNINHNLWRSACN